MAINEDNAINPMASRGLLSLPTYIFAWCVTTVRTLAVVNVGTLPVCGLGRGRA